MIASVYACVSGMYVCMYVGCEINVSTYFRPSVAQGAMSDKNVPVFVFTPRGFVNVWIQMVMPALSALLSYTPREMAGYCRPFSWPYSTH